MKKFLALVLSAALVLSFAGCGKKDEGETTTEATGKAVQEEIVQLVNVDIPGLADKRDSAVAIYNDYFADSTSKDSETWRGKLENEALVTYDEYLESLNSLSYENAEVTNLRDLYIKSSEAQRDAIQYVVNAISEVDTENLDLASSSIKDSETYMKMYQEELKSLCEKYNITMIGEFGTSTETDAASSGDAE